MILNNSQIREILDIIRNHHNSFVYKYVTREISPEQIKELKDKGYIKDVGEVHTYFQDAYEIERLKELVSQERFKDMSYEEFRKVLFQNPIPMTDTEQFSINHVEQSAGQYITKQGDLLRHKAEDLIRNANVDFKNDVITRTIKTPLQAAIEERKTISELVGDLRRGSEDVWRDWHRVANTELQNARNHANLDSIVKRNPEKPDEEIMVFKRPSPDACFLPGTMVDCDTRRKPIETFTKNSAAVLTHEGRFKQAHTSESRDYDGNLIELELEDGSKLTATEDHMVLVLRNDQYYWMALKDIREDDVLIKVERNDLQFKCHLCKEQFSTAVALGQHFKKHGDKEKIWDLWHKHNDKVPVFRCIDCNAEWCKLNNFRREIGRRDRRVQRCRVCENKNRRKILKKIAPLQRQRAQEDPKEWAKYLSVRSKNGSEFHKKLKHDIDLQKRMSESQKKLWTKERRKKYSKLMKDGGAAKARSALSGKNISKPQKRLFDLVKNIEPSAVMEFPVKTKEKCKWYSLDIAIPEKKIDIEYDGIYWHKSRKKNDNERDELLKGKGWKIYRFSKIPTKIELMEILS